MVAGAVQSVICGPIELIKTHCQVSGVGQKKGAKQLSEMQVARQIINREGYRGLTKGLGLTVAREVPSFGAYFFCYQWFWERGTEIFPKYPISVIMFAGGMAGVGCWMVSYPTDVMKTRWQADGVNTASIYKSVPDCYRQTSVDGAFYNPKSAFWRGFGATAIRAFPVNAITFTVVNFMATNMMNLKHTFDNRPITC